MSISSEIQKFCTDLILGDFEDEQGQAAMIVGGAISMIPVLDQVMDVRDVTALIFKMSKKGVAKCDKDDWMFLALAALGCIPTVGSFFKTVLKPILKARKKGGVIAAGGNEMIDGMLASAKGAAIKFAKTINWAQNTQLAVETTVGALDSCVELLTYLSGDHMLVPDGLSYLARDVKPQVEAFRNPVRSGITQGVNAVREVVTLYLGEDALVIAQQVAYAAETVGNKGAKRNHVPSAAKPTKARKAATPPASAGSPPVIKDRDSPGQGKSHSDVAGTPRQAANDGTGSINNTSRLAQLRNQLGNNRMGLVGEHLSDYYHMKHKLNRDGAWPHGDVNGAWASEYPRTVENNGTITRPKELIPEDLAKVPVNGIDTIWQTDAITYDFVEAKINTSGGTIFNSAGIKMGSTRNGALPKAPTSMTARQFLLWCLLSEPGTGTQMSARWVHENVLVAGMRRRANLQNRWVYLFLATTTSGHPFGHKVAAGERPLTLNPALGIPDHYAAAAELLLTGRFTDLTIHDKHKPLHDISEIFDSVEIDRLDMIRARVISSRSRREERATDRAQNKAANTSTAPTPKPGKRRP